MKALSCTALAYDAARATVPGTTLFQRPHLYLSGRYGSDVDLLFHQQACHFGDAGACDTPAPQVRQVLTQSRLNDLASNRDVTFTLCDAARDVDRVEFAAVPAVTAAYFSDTMMARESFNVSMQMACRLGVAPAVAPDLWPTLGQAVGRTFLDLAAAHPSVECDLEVKYVQTAMREVLDRVDSQIFGEQTCTGEGPDWWVVLPGDRVEAEGHMTGVKARMILRAPLQAVLEDRPGGLYAWHVPQEYAEMLHGVGEGCMVMPVGPDREVDLLVLHALAASQVDDEDVTRFAAALLAAQA